MIFMREMNSSILLSRLDAYREAEAPCKQIIHRTLRRVVINEHANPFFIHSKNFTQDAG